MKKIQGIYNYHHIFIYLNTSGMFLYMVVNVIIF